MTQFDFNAPNAVRDLAREAQAKEILLREMNAAVARLGESQENEDLKAFRLEGYQEGIRAIRGAVTISAAISFWQTTLYPPPAEIARVFSEILLNVE